MKVRKKYKQTPHSMSTYSTTQTSKLLARETGKEPNSTIKQSKNWKYS